ncbi:SDR family NAD(P)-dependent oxidoreductase [Cohnella pontilimi]|uniref:SDR family NAD(P)-dependent oxidoreductase n=1 Tax=Cohnella pontilimi TaxID=2564100 RepID=UPI003CCC688B
MFEGQTVLITGAAGGIGSHLVRAYSEKGANVVATDLPEKGGEQFAGWLVGEGGSARFKAADLRKPEDIVALFAFADELFGGIDILINNAGYGVTKSPLDLTVEEWDGVLDSNLRGTFLCSREAARRWKNREKHGSIVNIASTRALQSEANTEAYAASKGGIVSLTHAMAVSFGEFGVRVNAISPGWIEFGDYTKLRPEDHRQHPAGRVGTPEDIVRACFYLTDPANDFVTGINLVVDGGMTRKMIYVPD